MKNYPKTLYITALLDDEDNINEWLVDTSLAEVANREEENTEVAVYQLVKTGVVRKTSKVVFE